FCLCLLVFLDLLSFPTRRSSDLMTVFMLVFPINRRGFAMGMAGLVISFAPSAGPPFAGWFLDYLPWRYLFYVVLLLAVIDVILRSEEHTSELQSRFALVCRLLLE